MIGASIEVNTVQFEAAMQRLQKGVREGFISPIMGILPTQARLLAERCQTFTPPRNVGQGKAAVARDITRIFRPLSQKTFTQPRIKKIIRTDDRPAWDRVALNFRGNSHNLKGTKAIGFSTSWHARNRVSRGRARGMASGRQGSKAKDNLGVVTLGPEARQVRRYIADKKQMVGWARAGWNQGIILLGGTVKAPWISKHGMGQGFVVNGSASPDPFIQVGNTTSWAKYGSEGEGNRIMRNAINARARDMEAYFNRMMRLAATKAQGGSA